MLDVILWPPIAVALAMAIVACVAAGALFKLWFGLLVAEIVSVLGLSFVFVVGAALLNDEITFRSFFVHGYLSLAHASMLAFFGALVFAGHFTRRLLLDKSRQIRPGRSQS